LEQFERDGNGAPIIRGVSAKLADLERRREYLIEKIRNGDGSRSSLSFARKEVEALHAAHAALVYHRNTIERMDEPLSLLREFVAAYEGPVDEDGRLRAVAARARSVLEEFEAL